MNIAAVYDYTEIAKELNKLERGGVTELPQPSPASTEMLNVMEQLKADWRRSLDLTWDTYAAERGVKKSCTEVGKVVEQLKADMKSELMKAYYTGREPRHQVTRATPSDYGRREGCWPGPSSWND